MIYQVNSADYVLRLHAAAQVMQCVSCTFDEAEMLVRHGYISFVAAAHSNCMSCRMQDCDGNCDKAVANASTLKCHNTNYNCGRLPKDGTQRGFTAGVHSHTRVVDTFSAKMWRQKAQRILTTEAF